MKAFFPLVALCALALPSFASTLHVDCSPTAVTNSLAVGSSLDFVQASGTGTFTCTGPSGPIMLTSVVVHLFNDYNTGNGSNSDPVDNSAKFVFSTGAGTWGAAIPTTMNLGTGVTVFTIGNANSSADTFTNTSSGGLGGTPYTEPLDDSQTGVLVGTFVVNVAGSVDAGGFTNGLSAAHISADYTFNALTQAPEPVSMALVGGGLLAMALVGRRQLAKKKR